jgi:adenylate cyclase class 2
MMLKYPLTMPHINIEIKARCNNHEKIRTLLQSRNVDFKGIDHQIDTYFKVNHGRLKLREGNIENHLIYYNRENTTGPKQSDIILFTSTPGSSLKPILVKANGILIVVDKKREIYFIENVKFHIDTVQDLGTFMEIEVIDKDGSIGRGKLLEQCNEYMKLFEIAESDLISVSYSDLLLEKGECQNSVHKH